MTRRSPTADEAELESNTNQCAPQARPERERTRSEGERRWWCAAPHLKVGGRMLIDDAYMPPVAALVDALRAQPGWEIAGSVGYRTVVVRKTAEGIPHWDWAGERIGGRMSFRYLPPGERAIAAVRHRVFSTRAGLAFVSLLRWRSGLRWKQTG